MKFELKPYNQDISNDELLNDLSSIAEQLGKSNLTEREYKEKGKIWRYYRDSLFLLELSVKYRFLTSL